MPKPPSGQHDAALDVYCKELESEGYRVVKTAGKIPDAIAAKDGKLYAVEILMKIRAKKGRGKGWKPMGGYTIEGKRRTYSMYDDVLIRQEYRKE